MDYEIVRPEEEHIRDLAENMRKRDVQEVLAISGMSPEDALRFSVRGSRNPMAWRVDGRVVCMLGVCKLSLLSDTGIPWLLGSDLIPANKIPFLREGRKIVRAWAEEYPKLANLVDARYNEAIRWIKWLGFTVDPEPVPAGKNGELFYRFELRK